MVAQELESFADAFEHGNGRQRNGCLNDRACGRTGEQTVSNALVWRYPVKCLLARKVDTVRDTVTTKRCPR